MQEMSKTSDEIKPKTIVYIKWWCAKNKMQIFINNIKSFKFVLAAVLAEDCMLFTRVYDVLTDYPILQLVGWSHACLQGMPTSSKIRTRAQMMICWLLELIITLWYKGTNVIICSVHTCILNEIFISLRSSRWSIVCV